MRLDVLSSDHRYRSGGEVMATVTRGSYPHPVLDGSDDVASTIEVFNVTVTPTVGGCRSSSSRSA